jgi:Mce-associated membrane protein
VIRLTRRKPPKKEEDLTDERVTPDEGARSKSGTANEEATETNEEATEANGESVPESSTDSETAAITPATRPKRAAFRRALVFGLLPGLAMLLAGGVGYLKWDKTNQSETQTARIESVQAATDSTIKILSYNPDTVDRDLDAAQDRLTGTFRDSYTELTRNVVIPGAKQKKISAVATVPAAVSISASPNRAVVMVFVNQTTVVGNDAPSSTASTVRVTMERQDNRWLISDFTPI